LPKSLPKLNQKWSKRKIQGAHQSTKDIPKTPAVVEKNAEH